MDIIDEVKQKLSTRIKYFFQKNQQRIYIDILPEDLVESAKILFKDLGFRFAIASGIDTRDGIEILYHFSHDKTGKMVSLRILIPDKKNPVVDSLTSVIKGTEWIEREIWELLGVNFRNHPNLKHLLLVDDWPEGNYPLRQDSKDN
jgi:NADH:ubiquinone oxidoreductase subunit C